MTLIRPNLYLGSAQNCGFDWLSTNNINIVINVARELADIQYPNNIKVFKYPIDDIVNQKLPQLDEIADLIHTHRNSGNILIHCHMGISRSASFVIYYLMKYYNKTFSDAYDEVLALRPIIKPNIGFMTILVRKQYS